MRSVNHFVKDIAAFWVLYLIAVLNLISMHYLSNNQGEHRVGPQELEIEVIEDKVNKTDQQKMIKKDGIWRNKL